MKFKIAFVLFVFFMLLPVGTACFNIEIAKASYFPKETFQAEITGTFAKKLDYLNLFLYKNQTELLVPFFLEQLASNKYFVYFDLPESYGAHSFAVKDVLCIENETLVSKDIEKTFVIKRPIYLAYSWLSGQVANWQDLSTEENALTLLALAYDSNLAANGKTALLEKRNEEEDCWPSTCSVKATALASLAILPDERAKNWLLLSQNSVGLGLWSLIINSTKDTICALKINNQEEDISVVEGINSYDISLPDNEIITITLNCTDVSAKITRTYLGAVDEFPLNTEGNLLKATLSNEKCWGSGYRSECNAEATAYALWALDDLGVEDTEAVDWLLENAKTTKEKAFAYFFTKDSTIESWLLHNQAREGYWKVRELALPGNPDIEATVIASFTLGEGGEHATAIEKAKSWLLEQYIDDTFGTVQQTALILHKIFPYTKIEPILSINPAVIKTKANEDFSVILKNKGILSIDVLATTQHDTKNVTLASGGTGKVTFSIPSTSQAVTFSSLEISYNSVVSEEKRLYKIPLMIFPAAVEIEEEVNKTIIEEDKPLIEPMLAFVEEKIEKALKIGEKTTLEVSIKNPSADVVENVEISYSYDLLPVLEKIEPYEIEKLEPGEEKKIRITLNAEDAFGLYSGLVEAQSAGISISLPVTLDVQTEEPVIEEKTCAELEGVVCSENEECEGDITVASDTDSCCIGVCKEKEKPPVSKKRLIGIVLIVVAIIAVAIFLLIKLRPKKKKEEIREILGRIEEKYKK